MTASHHVPVFRGDLVTHPVDVGEKSRPAGVGAATRASVGLPTVFYVSLQVPLCAVAIVALQALVFLLCVHFHEVLRQNNREQILNCTSEIIVTFSGDEHVKQLHSSEIL